MHTTPTAASLRGDNMSKKELIIGKLEEPLSVNQEPTAPNGRFLYLSPQWWAIVQQQLGLLDNPDFWEGTEEQKDNALQWLYEIMEGSEMPSNAVVGISFNPDTNAIEYTLADDTVVQTQMTVGCCYPPPLPFTDDTPENQLGALCSAVNGMVDKTVAIWSNALDEIALVKAQTKLAVDAAIAIAETFTLGALELAPLDEFSKFVFDTADLAVATIKTNTTSEAFKDEIKENLYCTLRDLPDKSMTEEIYDDWLEGMLFINSEAAYFIAYMKFVMKYKNSARLFFAYSKDTSSLCEELYACGQPDGCTVFPSGSGWNLITGSVQSGDPTRVNSVSNGAGQSNFLLEKTFSTPRTVISVHLLLNKLNAPISANSLNIQVFFTGGTSSIIYAYSGNDGSWSYWWNLDGAVNGTWNNVEKIWIIGSMATMSGVFTMKSIEVCTQTL